MKEKENYGKVRKFLGGLSTHEYSYLELTMQVAGNIKNLMLKFNIDKETLIEELSIKPETYDKYISGNFDYSIMDMANVNATYMKYQIQKLSENPPCGIKTVKG